VEALLLSAERRGNATVISVRGDLDIVTSPSLDECMSEARHESDQIILDLAGVEFMDTSALAVIVGHWKRLEASDGTLSLVGARYRYTKTLWITGLADRLAMYDTVEQALGALASHSGAEG
jgi:anti-anti-sigma factor